MIDQEQTHDLLTTGKNLSPDAVSDKERDLRSRPDDLEARIQLLGFYFLRQRNHQEFVEARIGHILWIIEHAPDSEIAGLPYASIHHDPETSAYSQARSLWQEQVEQKANNPKVLWNAAHFVLADIACRS